MKRVAQLLFLGAFLPGMKVQSAQLVAHRDSDFSTYTLALSWQSGFCQSMSERKHYAPDECKLTREQHHVPQLTLHGLWPSLPKTLAGRGIDNKRWMRFGCATRPLPNYPQARGRKCDLPDPIPDRTLRNQLNIVMPGAGGRSCLERYEYAKHGACFGFDPKAWSGTMVRLSQEVNNSMLGQWLTQHTGQTVTRTEFNHAINQSWGTKSIKAFKLTCHGNPAYLTQVQIVIDARQINFPLTPASLISQPHPGNCPAQFMLKGARH